MNMGGVCIGCTMPGFPDKFSPIYERPPGALLSTNTNRVFGGFIRRLRHISQRNKMQSTRWGGDRDLPSGWQRYRTQAVGAERLIHKMYERKQHTHEGGH
jgi:hydrogenase small subunit